MKDTGRWRICEEIAKSVPFDVDTIYETYTYVLEQNKKRSQVVTLNKQLQDMKTILEAALSWQLKPLTIAIEIFEINEN